MSATQNLGYALVQVAHNFGAVAAVGGSLAAAAFRGIEARWPLAKVVLAGWATQAVSGTAFGAISFYFYGRFPDLGPIALVSLGIKITCVAIGFLLVAGYLFRGRERAAAGTNAVPVASSALAVTALTAAAFLRWFS